MRSFATIATFAALAFSAVTSAFPAPPKYTSPDVDVHGFDVDTIVVDIHAVIDAKVDIDIAVGADVAVHGGDHHGPKGIPDILVGLNAEVVVLVEKLVADIHVDVKVDAALKLFVDALGKIQVLIKAAVDDIHVIVGADVNAALYLAGKVQDVKIVVELLAKLVNCIVLVLGLAVRVCISADITVLLAIVVDIAASLSLIVGAVVQVSASVLVELQASIHIIVHIVVGLKLKVLANVLGISI